MRILALDVDTDRTASYSPDRDRGGRVTARRNAIIRWSAKSPSAGIGAYWPFNLQIAKFRMTANEVQAR